MGKPLHISALIQHLAETTGHTSNPDSLSSNMRKEKRGRFKNAGNNTWGLAEWGEVRQPQSNAVPTQPAQSPRAHVGGERLTDMCERILREAGKPLHGKVLLEKLAEKNRPTSSKSLSGAMPQDYKQRFENLGGNIWALTEWPESAKEAYRARKEPALPL
jgi:DNA-directed RNA polymerase delta subunit